MNHLAAKYEWLEAPQVRDIQHSENDCKLNCCLGICFTEA